MDLFGIDIINVILTTAFVCFWGAILIGFIIYWDKNPYAPRKYHKVRLKNKDGHFLRWCKGWIVKTKKVKYFRVGLKDFPEFKGVELDISVMETMDEEGVINLIEGVPGRSEPNNYVPENVPITQKEAFIKEITSNIAEDSREAFEVKVRTALNNFSRLTDLNTSKATKEYLAQARRESERAANDDFIKKYETIIITIMVCLFAYLIMDSATKQYAATMAGQNAVMEHGYSQVIQQCGGVYHELYPPQNNTQPQQQGVSIPFITK